MSLLTLHNVTLLGIDGHTPLDTLRTMHHSMRQARFAAAVIVSDRPIPDSHLRGVTNLTYPLAANRSDYELAVLRRLHTFFQTPFVLHQEWDSILANPLAWDEGFTYCDYIGAPWPYPFHGPFPFNIPFDPITEQTCVGNGGFTLLSKRLCEQVSAMSQGNDIRMRVNDVWIGCVLRPELERRGLAFASESLAFRFSCENRIYTGEFGIHGKATLALNGINLTALNDITW